MEDTFKSLGKAEALRRLYAGSGYKQSVNPSFECSDGHCVTASRLLLEGMDFDLTFFPFKHLGRKAAVQVTGELFASLATPAVLKAVLGISSKLDFKEVSEIWSGLASAAKEFGYREVDFDVVPSLTGLSISVSAGGFISKSLAAKRPIAKSMDLICLSNNVGASFLGEQLLRKYGALDEEKRQKKMEENKQLIGAYLAPELSPFTLQALSDSEIVPSFGFFCTDGLSNTLKALGAASGLGIKVYVDKIPFAGGSIDAATALGLDPLQAALRGGDDNCLLFTVPIGSHERFRHDFQNWDVIGHLARPEVGTVLVSPDGLEHVL